MRARSASLDTPSEGRQAHVPPPVLRDAWSWLAAASALLLPLRLAGTPLGQALQPGAAHVSVRLESHRVEASDKAFTPVESLKNIYNVRSKLVHGAAVKPEARAVAERDAADLARAVTRKAIENGWPNDKALREQALA